MKLIIIRGRIPFIRVDVNKFIEAAQSLMKVVINFHYVR